jgi:lysophospholipase L1-like esterase
MRGSGRLPRPALLAVAVTVALAVAASAAYQVERRAAHAHAPAAKAVSVTLRAAVEPASVPYGGTVRVDGVVRDEAGAPVAGRAVEVIAARADQPAAAAVVGTPTSDVEGRVSASFRPAAGSAVWMRFAGEPGLVPAMSETVRVGVVQRVTVAATTKAVPGGWSTVLRGAVSPARPGQPVRLDLHDAKGWRTASVGTLTAGSRYAFTVRHAKGGTFAYRVVRPADTAYDAGSAAYDLRLAAPRAPRAPALPGPKVPSGGGPGRLLVTGDSLAYYLGQQVATARGKRPTAVESRPSSGLARPDYFDWTAHAQEQVTAEKPGSVVVFLGANDCQPIRKDGTGAWTSVGSAGWVAEYHRRAAGLMRAYTGARERPVLWIGLPIAREAATTTCYRALNGATAAAARDVPGVRWTDSWSLYAVNGHYSDTVQGVLARQEDGIHLTFAGTRFLTRKVLGLLGP